MWIHFWRWAPMIAEPSALELKEGKFQNFVKTLNRSFSFIPKLAEALPTQHHAIKLSTLISISVSIAQNDSQLCSQSWKGKNQFTKLHSEALLWVQWKKAANENLFSQYFSKRKWKPICLPTELVFNIHYFSRKLMKAICAWASK